MSAVPKRCFWPPPPSTSLWTAETEPAASDMTLAQAARRVTVALRQRGYLQQGWFPIGIGFIHGFAVTTRLEQFDAAAHARGSERWISWHPEAANLFWLSQATSVRLPHPGQYEVFLLAFTDLPLGPTPIAPTWGRDTVMAGPEVPETLTAADLPAERHLRSARLGVYAYVYEASEGDKHGRLVSGEARRETDRTARPPAWIANALTAEPRLEP